MMSTIKMASSVQRNRLASRFVRAASTSATDVFGGDAWRYDKGAFKSWVTAASKGESPQKGQLYGYLALSFGDVDVDKDGFINNKEFDALLEKVASLPRRYGLAPTWQQEYEGDVTKRSASRKAMFDEIESGKYAIKDSPKPGKIAMRQFVLWATEHIFDKVATLDGEKHKVAFRHIEGYTKEEYLATLRAAIRDGQSGEGVVFYNYLLTSFVQADTECRGAIHFEQFDKLIDVAAVTPRFFGLAPDSRDVAARRKMFEEIDVNNEGFITFRKFLEFTRKHVEAKLAAVPE
jgi:hypothetical protein